MKRLKALSIVPVILAAVATSAAAQDARPADTTPRAYFEGIGGAAFNVDFDDPAPTFAAEYGERVHRDVYAYASFRFIENLMSDEMRINLQTASTDLGLSFSGRDRGLTFTVGAKYMLPRAMRFRPYFGGGLGVLNLKRRLKERGLGDVSEQFFLMTGLNDGVVDVNSTSSTNAMGEVMVGLAGATSNRTYIDLSYRYGRAFHTTEAIDFGQLSFGLGVSF